MTGIWLILTFCLILWHKVNPSISCIIISLITRSGVCLNTMDKASLPLVLSIIWKSGASSRQIYLRISSSSSTIKTLYLLFDFSFTSSSVLIVSDKMSISLEGDKADFSFSSISFEFRCLFPSGKRTINLLPLPFSLFSTRIVPWCNLTNECTKCNPIPVPMLELFRWFLIW